MNSALSWRTDTATRFSAGVGTSPSATMPTASTLAATSSLRARSGTPNISLRTGCFCNPGAGEIALQISRMELAACFSRSEHAERLTYDNFRMCIDGKASGAVRISVGMVTNFEDVQRLLEFAAELLE